MTTGRLQDRSPTRMVSVFGTLILLSTVLAVSSLSAAQVGVKAGDFIRYEIDFVLSGAPAGVPVPTEALMEILSVEGTDASIRTTAQLSDGTEQNVTATLNIVSGQGSLALPGLVIPADLTTGDSVSVSGFGSATIEGETTRDYAGASRTVVHTSFSQFGTNTMYYWDKQTGVMVEQSVTGTVTGTVKAVETNMWGPGPPFFLQVWFLAIVAAAIVAVIVTVFILRKRIPRD